MKKPTVAFITPIYLPANLYGSDNAVRIVAQELAQFGVHVSIITSNALRPRYWYDPLFASPIASKMQTIQRVKIYRLPCNQVFSCVTFILSRYLSMLFPLQVRDMLSLVSNGPRLVGLTQALQKGKFDVIHVSPFPLGLNKQVTDAVACMSQKPKVILTPFFHSRVPTYYNSQLATIIQKADVIHTVSHTEKRDIEKEFPESVGKTEVIPLFLRESDLHTGPSLAVQIDHMKATYNLNGRIIVLFAGLKGTMKGALTLLSAMQILYKQDPRFILVAMGHNTQEWNTALKTIEPRSLLDFSYVDEQTKEVLFAAAHIFCMPSKSESFGLVYLEAWHKKKPIIAADIPAVKELIGNAGVFVPYQDVKKLVAAIRKLGYNEPQRKALGNTGYKRLSASYSNARLLPQYKKLFSIA